MLESLSTSELTGIAALAVACGALIIAYRQYSISKTQARDIHAKNQYMGYLKLAFEHPKYALASYPENSPRYFEFYRNRDEYTRYEFYVSNLIFAVEQILELADWNQSWEDTVVDQLKYHAIYLDSCDFPEEHTDKRLLRMREKAIELYLGDGGKLDRDWEN
ncbi:hypothetical protein [Pseudoalteromonas rubra]|uniref:DUF4760 domain-containing protein n=1 Tax=Pseudoalteromonas rubra TaxID=43658 RepID=A0A0U3HT20_9GAMM|nr:hypothetical protein [Pseudoalteromonas rubra]ALU44521.1 hypothetical protein AT705_17230 [Pseudoalteromonas rubra]